jgi:hypothetical protein
MLKHSANGFEIHVDDIVVTGVDHRGREVRAQVVGFMDHRNVVVRYEDDNECVAYSFEKELELRGGLAEYRPHSANVWVVM